MLPALVFIMKKTYHFVNLLTPICLAMGILGKNEREYLRDDLKEVAVYGA